MDNQEPAGLGTCYKKTNIWVYFLIVVVRANLPVIKSLPFFFNNEPSSYCEVNVKNKLGSKKTRIHPSTTTPEYNQEHVILVKENV